MNAPKVRTVYQRPRPAETQPTRRVAELIGRLSDESPAKRRAAARMLLRMGPAIAPQLQWARQHGELGGHNLSWPPHHVPEVNQWRADARHLLPWHQENELDVLLSHLNEQRRAQTSILTLHHHDALLTNVLCDLGRQADADVAVGSFYFSLDWINTNRVKLTLKAHAEPKLSETGPHALVRLDQCVDDRGRSLLVDGKRMFAGGGGYSTHAWTVPLSLARLKPGRRIKMHLHGMWEVGA